jgi:predicted MFS family arabinose efflux permease
MNGWRYAYMLVTVFSLMGLALAIMTKPTKNAESEE